MTRGSLLVNDDFYYHLDEASRRFAVCKSVEVDEHGATREELEELIRTLRSEVARLHDEISRLRRDVHEVPPHYL